MAADKRNRKVIQAMLGERAQLSCNLDSSEPDDSVSLVLWYKDSSTVPIFSLDARSSAAIHEARHKPGPLLEGRSALKLLWLERDPLGAGEDVGQSRPSARRSRRNTSERHRKRHSRQQPPPPEGENDSGPAISSALVASRAAGQQLWAQLQVDSLSSEDNGVYVCRVDFRRARSRVQELSLRIIVPADTPTIRDLTPGAQSLATSPEKGASVRSRVIGPHNEGSRLLLECETQGGYPEPSVSWWRDGRLLDDSYEIVSALDGLVISQVRPADQEEEQEQSLAGSQTSDEQQQQPSPMDPDSDRSAAGLMDTQVGQPRTSQAGRLIRNRLEVGPLTRNDLLANYSCRAPNSKLQREPPSSFVMIDMNLRPVKVQIDNERLPVLADRPLEIVCRAFGSRPAALISWFRGPSSSSGDKLVPQHPAHLQPQPQQQQQQLAYLSEQIKIEESVGSESNVSSSTLTIVPRPHDSGQIVTCRAENPYMSAAVTSGASSDSGAPMRDQEAAAASSSSSAWIEDSWKLEVHYLPRAQLQLGEKLQGQSIREGQDVYFECRVQAQPYAHEIRWWFNGKELESNLSLGVIVSNQSLVLQRVARSQRGHYTCSAINSVGESHSSSLYLRVQFAPVCRDLHATAPNSSLESAQSTSAQQQQPTDLFRASSQQRFKSHYGAARMESVRVLCHVDADPADDMVYRWAFLPQAAPAPVASPPSAPTGESRDNREQQQQQQQMVYLDQSSFGQVRELGPLVSVATYTPRSELDYGTLLCWAQNELGKQVEPCAYQVVAAEPPDPVRNCRLLNASDSQLVVACEPGYDGGVDQSFQMEVYDSRKRELVANVSSSERAKTPALVESLAVLLANSSAEEERDGEQDDSPASAALSLTSSTASAHQPKQRHSAHHQPASGNGARLRPPPASALSGNHHSSRPQTLATVFITEPNLRPSTHYLLSIYSQNSKGASKPVAFTATTANSTSEPSARARFFSTFSASSSSSSSSSSPSQLSDSSHLLSDVLALSWNPFLLVCAISVALFVLFGSLTFVMMKYVDHSPSEPDEPRNSGADELALKQSVCLSKSDEQQGSSCGSSTNTASSSLGHNRRARIITLTANNTAGPTGDHKEFESALDRLKQPQKAGMSLLDSSSSYLRMRLQRMGEASGNKGSQLKQSNSDNFLDQLALQSEPAQANREALPSFQPGAFCSSSLQRPNARQPTWNFAHHHHHHQAQQPQPQQQQHHQRQPLLLNYVPDEQQPRIEQLLISGKQYFHQTAPRQQQRHLQMTSPYSANQRTGIYAGRAASQHPSGYEQQPAPCPHHHHHHHHQQQQQQLIDGQPGEQLNYCDHLRTTGRQSLDHQGDQSLAGAPAAAAVDSTSPSPHLAQLRLVELAASAASGQQLAHIDSDSTNSTNQTLPSLFSFTNGSPSSGIAMATPTSCSTANNGLALTDLASKQNPQPQPHPHPHQPSQPQPQPQPQPPQHQNHLQQQYCFGSVVGQADAGGGSNSTITSSLDQQQPAQLHESEGGNVISVSDCLLGPTSNLSSDSAASGQHHLLAAKISAIQFDSASDAGFEENNTQQYLAYSALGLPTQLGNLSCQADLNQYSVYVDQDLHVAAAAFVDPNNNNDDNNNSNSNNDQQQQIYLLQDQKDLSGKYPTKARVRVFSGSGSSVGTGSASLDRGSNVAANYLRLAHPNQVHESRADKGPDDSQQLQLQPQHPAHLHTDV